MWYLFLSFMELFSCFCVSHLCKMTFPLGTKAESESTAIANGKYGNVRGKCMII